MAEEQEADKQDEDQDRTMALDRATQERKSEMAQETVTAAAILFAFATMCSVLNPAAPSLSASPAPFPPSIYPPSSPSVSFLASLG